MSENGLNPRLHGRTWRRLSVGLLVLLVAVILAVTLAPTGGVRRGSSEFCLICGDRGLADAILNVLLFLPLGFVAATAGFRGVRIYVLAALFSAGIEGIQVFMASRDGSLGDLVFNTVGFVVGVQLFRARIYWSRSPASWGRALAFAAFFLSFLVLTAYLFQPSYPRSTYYGQWTPKLGQLARYEGRVLVARIGSQSLVPGPLRNSEEVRAALRAREPLEIRALAGPTPARLASLLSIADEQQRQIILLGPDGADLVFGFRTRARAARLDSPDLRLAGAFRRVRPREPMLIRIWHQGRGYCLQLDAVMRCRVGYTVGQGWALLLPTAKGPAWLRQVVDALWLALLVFPIGFWAPGGWRFVTLGVGLLLAVWHVPQLIGLVGPPGGELLGTALGLAAGHVAHRYARAISGGAFPRTRGASGR